ncbi:MAG: hypothetical protein Q7S80_02415 [bacterium]|nr:hypothetical protein [bacterium]
MRRSLFALVLVVVITVLLGGMLVACSGGGKGGGDNRVLRGLANVNAATTAGRVATCYMQDSSSELLTDTSGSLARSPSGWQDEPWTCPWPRSAGENLWALVAYNDLNHNNRLDGEAEFLGGSNLFLQRQSTGEFVMVDMVNNPGVIAYDDPTKVSIYINCVNAQRGRTGMTLLLSRLQAIQALLR